MHPTANDGVAIARQHLVTRSQHQTELVARRGALDPGAELDLPPFQIERPVETFNPGGWHDLEPNALPDAGRARIPDRVRLELPILLAARLGEVVWIVIGADDD